MPTNSIYIPAGSVSTPITGVIPAHRRYDAVLPAYTAPITPPYITQIRRLLAVNIPIVLQVNTSVAGEFEANAGVPKQTLLELRSNGLTVDTTELSLVGQQNESSKLVTFFYSGTAQVQFQNPVDLTYTNRLEWVIKAQLVSFTEPAQRQHFAYFNYQAIGAQETIELVPGQGTLLTEEGPKETWAEAQEG